MGRSLNDYVGEEKVLESSVFLCKLKELFSKFDTKSAKYLLQRGVENSRILGYISNIITKALNSLIRQYGVFAFSLGLYTVIVYFLGSYTNGIINVSYLHLAVGLAQILTSIPMLISKKTLCEALKESLIASFLLFDFLGLSEELFDIKRDESYIAGPFPLILGLSAGLATTFISPLTLLFITGVLIMAVITLVSPESGLVAVIAFMPFMNGEHLRYAVAFIAFSYIFKTLRGKRTFKLELTDYAVAALGFIVLLGSIITLSPEVSREYTSVTVTYLCAYFIIVNNIKTVPWINRTVGSVIFALVCSVLFGAIQKFALGADFIFTEDIIKGNSVTSFFSAPEALSLFIILFIFYLFAYNIRTKMTLVRRLFIFILSAVSILSLFYTDIPLAFCCFIAALFIFYMLYSKMTLIFSVLIAAALPFVRYILPAFIMKAVNEYIAVIKQDLLESVQVMKVSLNMALERMIGGSGSGSYDYIYTQYNAEGIVPASRSTYIQTSVELGIIGLIAFLIVIYLFIKCNFSLFAKQGVGQKNIYSVAGFSGIAGVLILANFENLWQDPHFIFAFWVALGLCMAIKRQRLSVQRGYDQYLLKNG